MKNVVATYVIFSRDQSYISFSLTHWSITGPFCSNCLSSIVKCGGLPNWSPGDVMRPPPTAFLAGPASHPNLTGCGLALLLETERSYKNFGYTGYFAFVDSSKNCICTGVSLV